MSPGHDAPPAERYADDGCVKAATPWLVYFRTLGRAHPALVAQRIECLASNQKAGGSIPSEGTSASEMVTAHSRVYVSRVPREWARLSLASPQANHVAGWRGNERDGIATFFGVCVAAIGYIVKYRTDLQLAQRNDRLERINRQLSDFYGPLLAHTRSSNVSWRAFRKRYRTGSGSFWINPPPTREDVVAWRLWMTTVFMPMSQRMMEIVLNRADLIEEPEMPPCLLALCAHVAGYQAVIKEWETGEISLIGKTMSRL